MHPEIESAILKMVDYIEEQEKTVLRKENASIEDLKMFQGKYLLLDELKHYRQRILDAVKSN